MLKEYIEIGKIVSTHGIKGAVKVQPFCDTPGFVTKFKAFYLTETGEKQLSASRISVSGNMVIIWFAEIESVEAAALLRNKPLYVARGDIKLPKGKYLVEDIIGCEVFDSATGKILGKVTDVFNTGANDIWEIKNNGKEYLLPIAPNVLGDVDVENGKITVTPVKGIFDED